MKDRFKFFAKLSQSIVLLMFLSVIFTFCRDPDQLMRPVAKQNFCVYTIIAAMVLEMVVVIIGLVNSILVAVFKYKTKRRIKKFGPNLTDMIILDGNVFYHYLTGKQKVDLAASMMPKKRKKKKLKTRKKQKKRLPTTIPTTQGDKMPDPVPVKVKEPVKYDPKPVVKKEAPEKVKTHMIMDNLFDHVILGKELVKQAGKKKLEKLD